jgi:hypothetical protein
MGLKLLDFDLFGSTVGFKFENQNIKRSYLGLFMSFTFLCIACALLIYFGKNFMNLEVIYQNTSDYRFSTSQNILLNSSFVFGLSSSIDDIKGSDIFNITVKYYEVKKNLIVNESVIPLESCNNYNWNNNTISTAQLLDTSNLTCYNVTNLRLNGNPMSDDYSFIDIKYYLKLSGDGEIDDANMKFIMYEEPVLLSI